ncbi:MULTISPECIES: CHAT domain-containing protein [unclassified Frankia]|uniref:CHAT domain-containing tetratricopeptide repeat protein n=1 Tax=unclassified Frankia TaxID=2632575 RepID=UPI001EE47204|nr:MULTISPECIES: CHAT domain-containing protein [unclassified Frankia]
MRDRLLEQVRARLERFAVDQDPDAVLDQEAVAEVTALLGTAGSPATDLEIVQVAGWLHWVRYELLPDGEDQADLTAALTLFAPVYQIRPDAVPDAVRAHFDQRGHNAAETPAALLYRAVGLSSEAMKSGDRNTLDEAIGLLQRAVDAISPDQPDRAIGLSALGLALNSRFERFGELADLEAAINLYRAVVDALPPDHPGRAPMLSTLGNFLRSRFGRVGELADLEAAIDAGRAAVAATSPDDPGHVIYLSNLGLALRNRFERFGELADLEAAIDAGRAAVDAAAPDDPDRARRLSNLGLALRSRFERVGELADLDAAIDAGRAAVDATPPGHSKRAGRLSNLGIALRSRFERVGELADLDAAIDADRAAIDSAPPDHPDRAGWQSSLGLALRSRFERVGELADLDAAIDAGRAAVDTALANHPALLSNLGNSLRLRFERVGELADLDAAIDVYRAAVDTIPPDHPDHAMYLSNLGLALRNRFDRVGELADLDAAIDASQAAVDATPPNHPDRAGRSINLGMALRSRSERAGELADLDAAIGVYRAGVGVMGAAPRWRAIAARGWGRSAAAAGRWDEAVAGFEMAVKLLGRVAPRSLSRSDQEHLLAELGGLGADAAACCVRAGLVDQAVELFEQGRGVLLGQALDTRTDVTALGEQHPDLAASFARLRDLLDRPSGPAEPGQPGPVGLAADGTVSDRRAADVAFEKLIASIRKLDGFETFLEPPPAGDLLSMANQGPIVAVAVSQFGSYALLLTSGGTQAVALPELTPLSVLDQVGAFLEALDDATSATARGRLDEILGWLWDVLASPVLDCLDLTGAPASGDSWPRLWWCVSGLLSFLPVHAAGHHQTRFDAQPATVLDRVISSYTPTLRALAHARRTVPTGGGDGVGLANGRLVAVAMPNTPDAPDLPGALTETTALAARFPGQVDVLAGEKATRQAVLNRLPGGRWAHFACHGAANLTDPSLGRLLLADQPLTVLDVNRLRIDDAQLAFLSACSTAMPSGRLTDEAIHLASAFQLAGYQHVIATLWPIDDTVAGLLADEIYSALTDPRPRPLALAVHQTVRWLRGLQPDRPSWWASHIHNGI